MNVQTWPRTRAEYRELVSYLRRKTGDSHAAEDLAQDSIVRLLAYMERTPVSQPRALIFRIADNLMINWFRRDRSRREESLADDGHSCAADLERALLERERRTLVETAMRALPPRRREVIARRKLQGQSPREIALAMNISLSAVEKHIARGVVAMRARLQKEATGARRAQYAAPCVIENSKE